MQSKNKYSTTNRTIRLFAIISLVYLLYIIYILRVLVVVCFSFLICLYNSLDKIIKRHDQEGLSRISL